MEQKDFLIDFAEKLGIFIGVSKLMDFFNELEGRCDIINEIEQSVKNEDYFETKKFGSIYEFRLYRIVNYLIIRAIKPKMIIETGVLHGLTSQFLLHAVSKNDTGVLHSIDFPSYFGSGPSNQDGFFATLPPERESGWIVSEKYLKYWKLHIGKSTDILPDLLNKCFEIDMFIHDSEHLYSTMWKEMNIVWNKLKIGGILLCDNINCNTSFFDFCLDKKKVPLICPSDFKLDSEIRFGIIKK